MIKKIRNMNIKNYIKGGALFALTAFAVACSSDDDYSAPAAPAPVAGTAGAAIDLGLPSGTLWADHNVGATSAQDYGNYYGWGDPTGQLRSKVIADYTNGDQPEVDELFELYHTTYDAEAGRDTTSLYKADGSDFAANVVTTTGKDKDNKNIITAAVVTVVETKDDVTTETVTEYSTTAEAVETVTKTTKKEGEEDKVEVTTTTKGDTPILVVYGDKDGKSNLGSVNITYAYKGKNADIYSNTVYGNKAYDAATANWGGDWRMPTSEEIEELIEECEWELQANGYQVTGPNGNSIFLPFTGFRYGEGLEGAGQFGYYWSGVVDATYTFPSGPDQLNGSKGTITSNASPTGLYLSKEKYGTQVVYAYGKAIGQAIRPVRSAE